MKRLDSVDGVIDGLKQREAQQNQGERSIQSRPPTPSPAPIDPTIMAVATSPFVEESRSSKVPRCVGFHDGCWVVLKMFPFSGVPCDFVMDRCWVPCVLNMFHVSLFQLVRCDWKHRNELVVSWGS